MLGVNHSVRKTPLSSSTTKLHSAISPSMKDQWSGKTFRRFFLAMVASPSRSSAHSATAPTLLGLEAVAAVEFVVATLLVSMLMTGRSGLVYSLVLAWESRSQKLGPTGSRKSLWATR